MSVVQEQTFALGVWVRQVVSGAHCAFEVHVQKYRVPIPLSVRAEHDPLLRGRPHTSQFVEVVVLVDTPPQQRCVAEISKLSARRAFTGQTPAPHT